MMHDPDQQRQALAYIRKHVGSMKRVTTPLVRRTSFLPVRTKEYGILLMPNKTPLIPDKIPTAPAPRKPRGLMRMPWYPR